jgi:lysozyme
MSLARQLEEEEGRVRHAYQDHLGFWTVGIGRLIDNRKGGQLTDDEIDLLLANDIRVKTHQVYTALPWVRTMNEPRQAVVIGMCFQMGLKGLLGFVNTLAAMKQGKYAEAADGMLGSLWARQTPARAARMAKQMRTGDWVFKDAPP